MAPTPPPQEGEKVVTLQDIARHCHVALSTVSLAMRHDPRVKAATRDRVLAAAQELGYNPLRHDAARRLALAKHGQTRINYLIALIFPSNFSRVNYYNAIFRGISEVLMEEGYGLLTVGFPVTYPGDHKNLLPPSFHRGEVDAVLAYGMPWYIHNHIKESLSARSTVPPLVTIIADNPDPQHARVVTDDKYGAYISTRHLLELGHRDLLHIVFGPGLNPLQESRLAGVCRAMREFGLDPQHHLFRFQYDHAWIQPPAGSLTNADDAHPADTAPAANCQLIAFLRAHPRITAILTINDAVAINVWFILQQAGWHLPEEMSIIGFDDTDPLLNFEGKNILTSVRLPLTDIGRESARLAIRLVTQQAASDERIVLPVTLVVRGSTLAPARAGSR